MTVLDDAIVLLQAKTYSGSGNWLDLSGNGHDAVPSGSPGHDGSNFSFNGTDQYFTIADHADLVMGAADSFTLLVKFTPADVSSIQILASKDDGSSAGAGYMIRVEAGANVEARIADGVASVSDEVGSMSIGVEYVGTSVRDVAGDDVTGFLDGVPSGSPSPDTTTAGLDAGHDLLIGRYSPSGGSYFEGDIAAVVLWDRALSDAEVVEAGEALASLPASALGRHGDSLLKYLKDTQGVTSSEVVSALNEYNGITSPPRKEYKEARDTAFGINGH